MARTTIVRDQTFIVMLAIDRFGLLLTRLRRGQGSNA
jgi:hypothetical protein